ncbi:sensor histidine kinase [Paenibacillaceae bacterium WGS1546]|uniref:sensor histidine kinase n=1 Tax=Cohnella sp. WGS1546 TaxID=3366810 RepID=UPI00372D5F5E
METGNARMPIVRWSAAVLAGMLLLIAAIGGCAANVGRSGDTPRAEGGLIDLREWSWHEDGILPLNGEWTFEWLMTVGEDGVEPRFDVSTMEVPAIWDQAETGDGKPIDVTGYAVYRLSILHQAQREMMALKLPNIATAYELYVNGELVASRGKVGYRAEQTIPYQLPASVFFGAPGERTELKLVIANFDHRYGGIRTPIVMGGAQQIQKLQTRHTAQELLILGSLIMIGFYHIGLYLLRRKNPANFYFALLCLFVGLRMGLIGEGFLVQSIPALNWESSIRLEYAAFVLAGWSGFAYFQSMFPREIGRAWFRISAAGAALLLLIVVAAHPAGFTSWILLYQIYVLANCARALAGLIVSARRRREGATLALIGVAGLAIAIVNDIFFYNGWWRSIDLLPFGLLFLIAMNSFIISLRFSRTYERAEELSAQLKEWNNSLEDRIAERTEELKRMEQSRARLISDISHDLRTPITLLQGYLEALRDGVIAEPAKRDATIRSMLAKVESLNALIRDLFDLSVLEARRVELAPEKITLRDWRDRLVEQYELEMQSKGIFFRCQLAEASDRDSAVAIDIRRMDRVFANLLYNAIRHTPEGGEIRIEMGTDEEEGTVDIRITDSGSGIEPSDLPYLFDRFFKKDSSRSSESGGSGLGLSIAKEIVELHGGGISAYNSEAGGSVFRIRLPVAG